MEHTPTPWQLKGPLDVSACEKDRLLTIGMPLGQSNEGFEEAKKNAAFIVMACNAHDALLAAATRLAREVPCYCDRDHEKPDFKPCGCCDLAKVITQVRTEKEPYEKPAIRAGTPKETE